MNDKLKRMCKEAVSVYPRMFLEELRKNTKISVRIVIIPSRFEPGTSETRKRSVSHSIMTVGYYACLHRAALPYQEIHR
jgi:hypothetical protein